MALELEQGPWTWRLKLVLLCLWFLLFGYASSGMGDRDGSIVLILTLASFSWYFGICFSLSSLLP